MGGSIRKSMPTFINVIRCVAPALFLATVVAFARPVPAEESRGPSAARALSSYDGQVDKLLSQMTLAEKIGQMTQPEVTGLRDVQDITTLSLGSVLSGGAADPKAGNGVVAWTDTYDTCQAAALRSRLGVPLLYGIDAVHGHNNVLGGVIFPHNIGLGCANDPQLVEDIARITALEVRATGINWSFAPCVTVPRDERWGRTYEGYSENPAVVAELGASAVRGLQGPALNDPLRVLACAKHFVGDGGTSAELQSGSSPGGRNRSRVRIDQGNTQCDEQTLRRLFLPPYVTCIRDGVGSIMPSYSSWNGVKCTGNKYLLTTVLKEELGFKGFLISDYNAIDQVDPDFKTAIQKSISAGIDMAMVPDKYRQYIQLLTELVDEGRVPRERVDDAVRRILRVKAAMGLLDNSGSQLADRSLQRQFGSAEHRAVARDAVRKSIVLLKDDNKVLPISKRATRILVAGRGADDLGMQCGGWTIDWQGKHGNVTTGGTTILAAIRDAVTDQTEVRHSIDGSAAAGADVGIVVIGENPYAEGNGDNGSLTLTAEDLQTVRNLKQANIPVVVILLAGRPLVITDVLDMADAFVVAWLPGTEGQGVADVLFGDYKPTGKLSFTWPRSVDQLPINLGDAAYDPLFPYGFGLSY